MSTWLERCKEELQRAGAFDPKSDFYGGNTGKAVMELLELFDKQNHSGMSASLVASLFKQLVDGKPLTPLQEMMMNGLKLNQESIKINDAQVYLKMKRALIKSTTIYFRTKAALITPQKKA